MPEIGDEVRLNFSSQREDEAYVLSAKNMTHGDRTNPEIKFIRTIRGQSIEFHPDKIVIKDETGSSITIHKEQGILMDTEKTVSITAESDIIVSAAGKVEISGQKGIVIQKGESSISVDNAVDISSEHTRIE